MGTRSSFFQSLRRRWGDDEWADAADAADAAADARPAAPDNARRAPSPPCRNCARLRWFVGGVLLAAALLILHASAQSPVRPSAPSPSLSASKPMGAAPSAASPATDATIDVATPLALPPRPEQPIASAPLPAPAASMTASSPGRDPMWLVYQTIPLPSARLNRSYKARDLVRGGKPPYRIAIDGELPPGMFVEEDGALAGTPTKTGNFRFLLTATDASRTRNLEQALYEIRVTDPKPVAGPVGAPASAPSSGRPKAKGPTSNPLKSITEDQTNRTVPSDPPMPMTYVLTQAKLDEIFKNAEASTSASLVVETASGDADPDARKLPPRPMAVGTPVLGPTLDQLREMLTPLKDVEHPTRAVFQDSLSAMQCAYYLRHVNELSRELDRDQVQRCPRKPDLADRESAEPQAPGASLPVEAPRRGAGRIEQQIGAAMAKQKREEAQDKAAVPDLVLAPGNLALDRFLDMLMPAHLREEITDAAGETHPLESARPLNLVPEADCGCGLPDIENEVYGFLSYWMQGKDDTPIPVRFDRFTRLQYMGAILRNDGSYLQPPGLQSPRGGYARRVAQHSAGLDLVLYRRDFHVLTSLPEARRQELLATTAAGVGAMLDLRHSDWQGDLEFLLPPGWREEAHVYDGLTVFFEPTDEEAKDPRFERFFIDYVQALLTAMQRRKERAFHLNVVVPQHLLGESATAFRFRNLLAIMKAAEPRRDKSAGVDFKDRGAAAASYKSTDEYVGSSPVTVHFLAPLGVGSDMNKMQLRNRTDFTDELSGSDRMALLGSVMPMLVYPGGPAEAFKGKDAMDRDMVYIGWSFGGVALWPLPVANAGAGADVLDVLHERFWSFLDQDTRFCKIVCPMRVPLRLGLEALLVIVGTTLLLYGWNCRVRRMGKVILLVLWAGALLTLAMASAIFSCDPTLNQLRTGNTLLVGIVLLLIVGGLIVTFKPRVEAP
ncbi:MAG: hypothetical protein EOP37_16835 [Rubrivivax sp.]|nr:MAG: hypothetical protein EOP37_16835 [Rubrivivax sp.]